MLFIAECPAQQKLTADNDLLQHPAGIVVLRPSTLESVTGLTETPSNSEEYCSHENDSPPVGNYVNITFVHPMIVEKIVSRGLNHTSTSDTGFSYVSNFSIYYTNMTDGELQLYHEVSHQYLAHSGITVCYCACSAVLLFITELCTNIV